MIGTRKALRIDITIIICNPVPTSFFGEKDRFQLKRDVGYRRVTYDYGDINAQCLPCSYHFYYFAVLHPPSFHEMIFILVYIYTHNYYTIMFCIDNNILYTHIITRK